jgi:hypothetical protein
MARDFDGTSHRLLAADNAALSLPDGGFTISLWMYCDTLAATSRSQYFYSHGTVATTSSCNLYISEPTGALVGYVVSDGGTSKQVGWAAGAISAGVWYHICLRCVGDDLRIYRNGVQSGVAQTAAWNGVNPSGSLYLGARNDLNADRFFNGKLAELAIYQSGISDAQLAQLADGESPEAIGVSPAAYIRMLGDDYAEKIVPITMTNQGSSDSAHPPRMYAPRRRKLLLMENAL